MSKLPELETSFLNDLIDPFGLSYIIKPKDKSWLTKTQAEEVLRRCNCHDDLVAALETAEKELEQRYGAQEGSPIDRLTLKIVKDALAKAKKEP